MTEWFSVKGRVACVTGASSGIGRALAAGLTEAGAKVVGVARRAERLEEWRAKAGAGAAAVAADLSDPTTMEEAAARISAPFGPPDILINAAGINPRLSAEDQDWESWKATLDINLSTPFFLAKALVGPMKAKGWGRIVNIASLQTERAMPRGVAYGTSKGGVGQLTRAMAEAWSGEGVIANAIAPGFFHTELSAAVFADKERSARNAAQTCVGRNGELEDLVGPALFLCSEAAGYVTGQVLYVDGGFTAK